jgi:uncharacterized protein (TIGR00369 family)
MAAKLFMRAAKTALLLSVGMAGGYYGYKYNLIYNPFTGSAPRSTKMLYQFDAISKELQEYLRSNDFIEPQYLYDMHHKRTQMNTFFEKSLLMDLEAFEMLDFFVTREIYQDFAEDKTESTTLLDDEARLELYKRSKVAVVFKVSDNAQGHLGIVHGGFTATLIDNFFGGLGFMINDMKPVATTQLQLTYRRPLKISKEYMLVCEVDKIEGKHFHLKAYIRDAHNRILCESTARFTKVDWGHTLVSNLLKQVKTTKSKENSDTIAGKVITKVEETAAPLVSHVKATN